jgi:hypothetical protein
VFGAQGAAPTQGAAPAPSAPTLPQGTERGDRQAIDADDQRTRQDVDRIMADKQRGDRQSYESDRQQFLRDFDKRQRDQQQLENDIKRDSQDAGVPPGVPK